MLNRPYFILSLDTELIWGPRDKATRDLLINKCDIVRKRILILQYLLEKYQIPATWAVVGHLFLDHCEKTTCLTNKNINEYNYHKKWYTDVYSDINCNPLYYGRDIIENILSSSVEHEIGYHSFSHPSFTEISYEMAEDEIRIKKDIENEWGIRIISFVYPRNEIKYLDLLIKYDFKIFRGCPPKPADQFIPGILGRSLEKILAIPVEATENNGIYQINPSMNFCDPQLPRLILPKAKFGIEMAQRENKVFHIYFHPWNLILYDKMLADLENLFKYVARKRERSQIECCTMGALYNKLKNSGSDTIELPD